MAMVWREGKGREGKGRERADGGVRVGRRGRDGQMAKSPRDTVAGRAFFSYLSHLQKAGTRGGQSDKKPL
jgi:hypothetical protein